VCAGGLLLMTRIGAGASVWADVVPAVAVFGVGLTVTVAPLTTAVLSSAPARHVGAASGVNNAVARTAGLVAVAVLPLAAGLSDRGYREPAVLDAAFDRAMLGGAALLVLGAVLARALVGPRTVRTPDRAG
jgi:hypothetical protein